MTRFWSENEFRNEARSPMSDFNGITYRWDVVRTANSEGCFRAETMELRALLPTDKNVIHNSMTWQVKTPVDLVLTPNGEKYVDVNYYMINPYAFPLSRSAWAEKELGSQAEEFLQNSYQFEYLDPATLEFTINGRASTSAMSELNRAGGSTSL